MARHYDNLGKIDWNCFLPPALHLDVCRFFAAARLMIIVSTFSPQASLARLAQVISLTTEGINAWWHEDERDQFGGCLTTDALFSFTGRLLTLEAPCHLSAVKFDTFLILISPTIKSCNVSFSPPLIALQKADVGYEGSFMVTGSWWHLLSVPRRHGKFPS